jgi:hypothetical protein
MPQPQKVFGTKCLLRVRRLAPVNVQRGRETLCTAPAGSKSDEYDMYKTGDYATSKVVSRAPRNKPAVPNGDLLAQIERWFVPADRVDYIIRRCIFRCIAFDVTTGMSSDALFIENGSARRRGRTSVSDQDRARFRLH